MRSLLTVGYARPGYGFGRVMNELHRAFADEVEVEHLDLAQSLPRDAGIPVPRRVDAGHVWRVVGDSAFDAVLLFSDLDFVAECAAHRSAASPRLVAYVPIDSPVEPSPALAGLAGLDALVVYTHFALDSLLLALAQSGYPAPPIHVVPHGCDVTTFFPLDADPARARAQARDALFGPDHSLHDAFLVLNANRNQPRKRIDLTLLAFRRFLDLVPDADARLYLHMGLRDRGVRILPLAAELGIDDRLLLTGHPLEHPVCVDATLNLVYNACDVGLNTADAEGWGLVSFEHAATRKAQLVPEHTGCGEIWRGHACMIPAAPYRDVALDRQAFEVDADAIAAMIARLYRDPAWRSRHADLAFHNVRQNTLTWAEVGRRLAQILRGDAARVGPGLLSGAEAGCALASPSGTLTP
jgi:D-inositol-3-phosphate glycosyltransferase